MNLSQMATQDSRHSTRPNNSGRPIFIFGCSRSGTSLFSRIISAHPNIGIPFESHLYNTFQPWLKHYGDLNIAKHRERLVDDILSTEVIRDWTPQPDRQQILAMIDRPDFHGVVDGIMRAWVTAQGKTRWGEKTPPHAYYWREILDGFPDLQVLHIVRDGRDVALSWRQARFGPKHMYQLAQGWVDYLETVETLKKALPEGAFFELCYEELVADPESVMQKVCAFLGEDYTPELLSFHENSSPYPTDSQNEQNLHRPTLPNNTGKWRTGMTANELRIFEAVAGPVLERYGYERQLERPHVSQLETLRFRYLEHPPKKILAMVKNRKGHIDGLRRLRIYLRLVLGL